MKQSTTHNRRDFLKTSSAATLAALAAGEPRFSVAAEEQAQTPAPKADAVIVLWMGGGMAHTETFDPKRHTPFRKGLPANEVLSTFPAIDTVVDDTNLGVMTCR